MKSRTDQILLAVFLASAALYVFILLTNMDILPLRVNDQARGTWEWLMWRFHAVPCICLQLLLCRLLRWNLFRLLPLLLLGTAMFFLAAASFLTKGWGSMFWGVRLVWCCAPAAGLVLGWIVYGFWLAFKP